MPEATDLIAAFQHAMRQPSKGDAGVTTRELAKLMRVGTPRASELIRDAFDRGLLTVGRKPETARDGRQISVPCYELKPEAKRAAKRR